ncbi:hypothetical protein ACMGGS_12255 [Superficieibacter sp. BNK-5]|uniref:hypothetical protein n=1 Tax=Superficieibacter sp. BNK-5 TaxID=3376142 RepID=UPI0039BF7D5F
MKTQMQIVQEAIARLNAMSSDEFRATLVAAGAIETGVSATHMLFSKIVRVSVPVEYAPEDYVVEETNYDDFAYTVIRNDFGLHSELSLVF